MPSMPSTREPFRLYSMTVDTEINAVRFRWEEQPTGEEFRYGANQLLKKIRSQAVSSLLLDARTITAHQKSSLDWIMREWMPQVASAGIEHVAVVHESDLIARVEMESLQDQVQQSPSFPRFFATESPEAARRWISKQHESRRFFFSLTQYLSALKLFSLS